jgi:hypothetical protein
MVREGRVFISSATDPDFGAGYYVQALEVGAQVSAGSSGNTIAVRAGHGFAALDKLIVGTDTTKFKSVLSVTSTQLTLDVGQTVTVAAGDLLVNLGADTGSTSPQYDGNGLTIYTDMDYSTQATTNTVLTDANGRYRYHHKGVGIWELVRSGLTPIALYANVYTPALTLNFDKPSANATDATGLQFFRDGNQVWAFGEDFYSGTQSYFALWSHKGITGTSGDIFGVSWFGAETENIHGGVGGADSPKWCFNTTPFGNYASSWTYLFMGGGKSGAARQALFGHLDYSSAVQGGVDVYFSGTTNNGIELRNDDGSSFRSTVRFCRTTTQGGSTIGADWLVGMGVSTGANTFHVYDQTNSKNHWVLDTSRNHGFSTNGLTSPTHPFHFQHSSATTNAAVDEFKLDLRSSGTAAVGLGLYHSLFIQDAGGTSQRAASLGAVLTDATAGAITANAELWSSYVVAPILAVTHTRRAGINTTSPPTALSVGLDAANEAALTLAASTSTPPNPSASSEGAIYVKGGKLVLQYNDATTVRYKYLDLTGTGVTWVHTTSAP